MKILAIILDGPITPAAEAAARRNAPRPDHAPPTDGNIGAALRFEGIVRLLQHGRELRGLDYQTYDPMAQQELESLAESVAQRHQLSSVVAIHSRGLVRVGEVSFVLEVTSPHRAEAIAGLTAFIDQLKQDVPIWKQAVWQQESGEQILSPSH